MRKLFLFSLTAFTTFFAQAQEQYLGMASSPRGGIISADINPAEISNMYYKYEVGIFSLSAGLSNDRTNLLELDTDDQTQLILDLFKGDHTTNLRVNATANYPSFAMRANKWGFGFNLKTHASAAMFDTSYNTGNFKLTTTNGGNPTFTTSLNTNGNSRITAATWSEFNINTSRILIDNEAMRINAGLSLKLLFPATYMNLSLDQFNGTAVYDSTQKSVGLSNVPDTKLNIDYTGEDAKYAFGGMNGFGTDIGFTYTMKDSTEYHRIKVGVVVKNIGSMTYEAADPTGSFNSHVLNTQNNLLDFDKITENDNVETIGDFENELSKMGVLKNSVKSSSRKVSLPTTFVLNTDFKIVPKFHVSLYGQFKFMDPSVDYVIPTENVYAVTPRFTTKYFDLYSTWASYELTGIVGGAGFRVGGFYIGSRSLITGLMNGEQIDVNFGARWAFGN